MGLILLFISRVLTPVIKSHEPPSTFQAACSSAPQMLEPLYTSQFTGLLLRNLFKITIIIRKHHYLPYTYITVT